MIKKHIKKGFSLVELLVVITIIAILSVVAYTAVGGQTIKARDAKRKQDLGIIQQALELYFTEKGVYPSSPLTYTVTPGIYNITKKHLSDIPKDPGSKKDYIYAVGGTSEYELAAALEVDGNPAKFESYVIGNAASPMATSTDGKYYDAALKNLANCAGAQLIITAKTIGQAQNKDCIPYDPRSQ